MSSRKPKEKAASFETQLAKLEELTGKLETGDLPLEEALEAYEEGVSITRRLLAQLDAAEKRIQALASRDGAVCEEPAEIPLAEADLDGESDG